MEQQSPKINTNNGHQKMHIRHDLLPNRKRSSCSSIVDITLYNYSSELWEELDQLHMINRLKVVPQLGLIKVPKRLSKSRYDYILLQLYFHQIIGTRLAKELEYSYGGDIPASEFGPEFHYFENKKASIGDIIQILTLVYSIGHFYNTFTASRAAIMLAKENPEFRSLIIDSGSSEQYRSTANQMVDDENYYRFHLLNSLIILGRCDQSKFSVQLATRILYLYLDRQCVAPGSKLEYAFRLFRTIRNVAYIAYDLQIAKVPFLIDLCNKRQMTIFFRELVAEYNDNTSIYKLITSMSKLLDDTIYHEEANALCLSHISEIMTASAGALKCTPQTCYYTDFFLDEKSIFNKHYAQHRNFINKGILKLTFSKQEKQTAINLFEELRHKNHICVGYYDRPTGERTIVISLKNSCHQRKTVSFNLLKILVKHLNSIPDLPGTDKRYLLSTKFFLQHYLGYNLVHIDATIDSEICVICARGKRNRINVLNDILKNGMGTPDQRHEVEHMKFCLENDQINDTAIMIPASILVKSLLPGQNKLNDLCEFDGLILFPNRREEQIVFLEAKNKKHSGQAHKCLCEKLEKVRLKYNEDEITLHLHDVYLPLSIKDI